jgi:hypothetical protein
MTTAGKPAGTERVTCEVCLKEVPRSEASVSETRDHVAYFCGPECYRKWFDRRQAAAGAAAPEPEIQLGHGRSKARDERVKRALRQHPQRDEPRVDSVEDNETPPRAR